MAFGVLYVAYINIVPKRHFEKKSSELKVTIGGFRSGILKCIALDQYLWQIQDSALLKPFGVQEINARATDLSSQINMTQHPATKKQLASSVFAIQWEYYLMNKMNPTQFSNSAQLTEKLRAYLAWCLQLKPTCTPRCMLGSFLEYWCQRKKD